MTANADFKDLMAVIPAYNAGNTLAEVLQGVLQFFERQQILVIDDGSSDDTASVARRQGATLLQHGSNRGKGAALRTAFGHVLANTQAQALISLDADGQHQPEELPGFARAFAATGAELIIGSRRFDPRVMPWLRVASNRLTSRLLSWKIRQPVQDSQSGYRLYSRRLLERLKLQTSGYETESEIIIQAGRLRMKIGFIPIETIYDGEVSHIRGGRDIGRFLRLYLKSQ